MIAMATLYSTYTESEKTARAYARDMPCSPKSGRNVGLAIKGMPLSKAIDFLTDVKALKTPVPFRVRVRKIHHRRGTGFGPGRYPVQVARCFIKVLKSVEANAEYKGLDKERLVISHVSAYQGQVIQAMTPRAHGRATPHYNRLTNLEVVVTQSDGEETGKKAAKTASRTKTAKAPKASESAVPAKAPEKKEA